jgi:hypothetical protein
MSAFGGSRTLCVGTGAGVLGQRPPVLFCLVTVASLSDAITREATHGAG